jgi:predicted transporter
LGKALVNAQLLETPVRTYITQLFFQPDFILVGLVFLIAGLILTAYFLTKANNLLYDETNKYKTYTIASGLAVTASFLEKTKDFLYNQ